MHLFFSVLANPWEATQAIFEIREEYEQRTEELIAAKSELADEKFANLKLKEEIYNLKRGVN
jgi:microcompartment protein CcmL/EutN